MDVSLTTLFIQALLGVVPAIVAFLLAQFIGWWLKRKRLRSVLRINLIAEVKQNQAHQSVSTWISLEDDAFRAFRRAGFLTEQNVALRESLRLLYARVHEKNELLETSRAALAAGRTLTVGVEKVPMEQVIINITTDIMRDLTNLLPLLGDRGP